MGKIINKQTWDGAAGENQGLWVPAAQTLCDSVYDQKKGSWEQSKANIMISCKMWWWYSFFVCSSLAEKYSSRSVKSIDSIIIPTSINKTPRCESSQNESADCTGSYSFKPFHITSFTRSPFTKVQEYNRIQGECMYYRKYTVAWLLPFYVSVRKWRTSWINSTSAELSERGS